MTKKEYVLKMANTDMELERKQYCKVVSVWAKSLRGAKQVSHKHADPDQFCLIFLNDELQAYILPSSSTWVDPCFYHL
ncbi:MAG: hypothetical protein GW898_10740 [Thiomicrospira sp.]|nr:hypothetical protein [Thiomicrospira sp.]NCN66380.1 hypothetical protein [Thiomicrospira sp.]NCO14834.1 hypothetical protein [Thiomicrospira sp.]NCO82430.1 hypothetical protein [Thiomicrospira sp.]OIP95440.1 MAG: hypothetical protein AUK56_05215 [Thiomicrospira sp. CG2_30_44_34]